MMMWVSREFGIRLQQRRQGSRLLSVVNYFTRLGDCKLELRRTGQPTGYTFTSFTHFTAVEDLHAAFFLPPAARRRHHYRSA